MDAPSLDQENLRGVAAEVRSFLEERWADLRVEKGWSPPAIASHDMCRFSALFLKYALEGAFIDELWELAGGDQFDDVGGIRATDGSWKAHYWVVAPEHGLIVDVTADQFGHAPVLVVDDEDDRYRPNMNEGEIFEHMKDVRHRVGDWLELRSSGPAPV